MRVLHVLPLTRDGNLLIRATLGKCRGSKSWEESGVAGDHQLDHQFPSRVAMLCAAEPPPSSAASVEHGDATIAALVLTQLHDQNQEVSITRCTTATTQIIDDESSYSESGSLGEDSYSRKDPPLPASDTPGTMSKRQLDLAFASAPPADQAAIASGGLSSSSRTSAFRAPRSKKLKATTDTLTLPNGRTRKVVMATPVFVTRKVVPGVSVGAATQSGLQSTVGCIQGFSLGSSVVSTPVDTVAKLQRQPVRAAYLNGSAQNSGGIRKVVMATGVPTTPFPLTPFGSWAPRPLAQ